MTDDATVDAQGHGPEPTLTRTRSVLGLVAEGGRPTSDSDGVTPSDFVVFAQEPQPGESLTRMREVTLDRAAWDDMGQPRQVTVTIEPRDLLNPHVSPNHEYEPTWCPACASQSDCVPVEAPPLVGAIPDRIAVDARGFGWRVWDDTEYWSMVPTTEDNLPIPEPITWFVPEAALAALREIADMNIGKSSVGRRMRDLARGIDRFERAERDMDEFDRINASGKSAEAEK